MPCLTLPSLSSFPGVLLLKTCSCTYSGPELKARIWMRAPLHPLFNAENAEIAGKVRLWMRAPLHLLFNAENAGHAEKVRIRMRAPPQMLFNAGL